ATGQIVGVYVDILNLFVMSQFSRQVLIEIETHEMLASAKSFSRISLPVRNSLSGSKSFHTRSRRWRILPKFTMPGLRNPNVRGGFLKLKIFLLSNILILLPSDLRGIYEITASQWFAFELTTKFWDWFFGSCRPTTLLKVLW